MDAIINVIEDWSRAKDEQLSTHAIFFDFAKAFDLVDHKVLLEKISKMLPEWLISWFAPYLTDCQQRVKVGTTSTEWKRVEAGVIQGSVLGPSSSYSSSPTSITRYRSEYLNWNQQWDHVYEKIGTAPYLLRHLK